MHVESNSHDNYRNTINDYFKGNWNESIMVIVAITISKFHTN